MSFLGYGVGSAVAIPVPFGGLRAFTETRIFQTEWCPLCVTGLNSLRGLGVGLLILALFLLNLVGCSLMLVS